MCGIVGEYGHARPEEGRRMLERLTHRGPDDGGEVRVNGSWLGHKRLSIVDVATGRQPLVTPNKDLYLVGNGEVYNHEEVKRGLYEEGGGKYTTKSDNEIALHLIRDRGPFALAELEGMFAFLAAGEDGTFVAARDPVGIKPLYWARRDGLTRFASEMSAFDRDWLPYVELFPPGHHWTPARGLERFADAVPRSHSHEDYRAVREPDAEDLAEVRDELIGSVERQLMGDVPVGVFLSGGLDSSLIAAIAAKLSRDMGTQLKTFAVGLEGSSDILAARACAEHIGSEHHERIYEPHEMVDNVEDVVRAIEHFDPSLVRSAVPNYLLAEMTVQHVKVVLTGEGADELFAGYEYLREFSGAEELHDEIVRTIEGLHNLNLQRCDRVTMAHGLEARVPFLDREVIALALRLPANWKTATNGDQEKKLLRDAFVGWLPDDLLWRGKEQFGDGSGASSVLTEAMEDRITEEEFKADRKVIDPPIRTREELYYYRVWAEHLGGVRPDATIARFATA